MANAALVAFSVTMVGEAAGAPSRTTHVPETPGVRTSGAQVSVRVLVDAEAAREIAAVKCAPPRVAVMVAL
jgi:hypothetical protein